MLCVSTAAARCVSVLTHLATKLPQVNRQTDTHGGTDCERLLVCSWCVPVLVLLVGSVGVHSAGLQGLFLLHLGSLGAVRSLPVDQLLIATN